MFVTRERKHATYTRIGNDVVIEKEVNLCAALTGDIVEITTLDKRHFKVAVVHIIRPGYEKVVPNEGFPIYGEAGKFP